MKSNVIDQPFVPNYGAIIRAVRPYSMVPEEGLSFTIEATRRIFAQNIPGAIVECGVWKGGASIAMLMTQQQMFRKVVRPVYMLDSFEGLPPVGPRDGSAAAKWQADKKSSIYYDNCKASFEEVVANLEKFGFGMNVESLWRGSFADTLPKFAAQNVKIALLRLDCDWYDSVTMCMEHLMPLMSKHGIVVIDDYYAWDGCARAVHDYLSDHDLTCRIRSIAEGSDVGAYFIVE